MGDTARRYVYDISKILQPLCEVNSRGWKALKEGESFNFWCEMGAGLSDKLTDGAWRNV